MTAFTIDRIKYEILTSSIEDIAGLYEVIWALNSAYPHISNTDKLNYSKIAILELLHNDVIGLYKKKWASLEDEKIDKAKALEIVTRDENWDVPSDKTNDEYYCFFANGDNTLAEKNKLYFKINGC